MVPASVWSTGSSPAPRVRRDAILAIEPIGRRVRFVRDDHPPEGVNWQ